MTTPLKTVVYEVTQVPDASHTRDRSAAGGDVRGAAWRGHEHVLRTIANMPPDSIIATLRYVYSPQREDIDKQSRLRIYCILDASGSGIEKIPPLLMEQGHLSRLYQYRKVEETRVPGQSPNAACEVVRLVNLVEPFIGVEHNERIPSKYYTIKPFQPNDKNDFLWLDSVLDRINETVVIDVRVRPVDISPEQLIHGRYLSRLLAINRHRYDEESDDIYQFDFLGTGSQGRLRSRSALPPMAEKDPLADEVLHEQQRFHDSLYKPHVLFQIGVHAETEQVAHLVGSVVAESAFLEGSYRLQSLPREEYDKKGNLGDKEEDKRETIPIRERFPEAEHLYTGLDRLSHLASVDELLGAFRLPIASVHSPYCIRKSTDPETHDPSDLIVMGYESRQCDCDSQGSGDGIPRGIPLKSLCKHTAIIGVPGMGKTHLVHNTLIQLHNLVSNSDGGVPFVAIELGKSEYGLLKTLKTSPNPEARRLAEKLEIYTPGKENLSPLRFNPLERIPNIPLNEHIEGLVSCCLGVIPVGGPLPELLAQTFEQVYRDYPDPEQPPRMHDLQSAGAKVLSGKKYSGETKSDIGEALQVRQESFSRRSLGRIFQSKRSIPSVEHLLSTPTVIQMDSLPPRQASTLALFILNALRGYARTNPTRIRGIQFAIFIEECHNVVGTVSETIPSEENPDPKAANTEFICRMLAEVRAMGIPVFLISQNESNIASEVMKNTSTKISFRQVAKEDREGLGATMLFGDTELEEVATLQPGEAFIFTEGYYSSRRIRTRNLEADLNLGPPPLNEEILPYIQDEAWFIEAARDRMQAELSLLADRMDEFDALRAEFAYKAVSLIAEHPRAISYGEGAKACERLRRLAADARSLAKELESAFEKFYWDSYQPLMIGQTHVSARSEEIRNEYEPFQTRFETIIKPDTTSFLKILQDLIVRSYKSLERRSKQ